MNCRFCVGPDDRVLALSSLGFDLSVYDIFGTLAAGGTIVMPGPSRLPDPGRWAQILNDEQVTIWNSVPALMEMLSVHLSDRGKSLPESLRLVLLSGDWVPVTLPGRINSLNKHAEVISLGGATEASIWSILHPISKVPPAARSIPYGKPMANQRFHVLNEALEPCPTWVPGQLYIAGTGLALGYWRDDEKTSAGFIVHPRTGDRLYKTGDLGRYLPDGNIEFLGREDFQVKVQGYRIELGEIEAALVQHPKVSGAMAIAAGQPGQSRRLAAYIAADRSAVSHDDLKSFLKEKIPAYMIPQAFVFVDSLPLTPNGKVDRKRLPDPFPFGKGAESGASTSEPIEKRITECICNILQVDEIDATVGLIELGATSVDIIRVVGQLEKELGFRPTFEEFYSSRSVKELARSLEQSLFDSKAVAPSPDRTISDGPINANTIHARTIVDPVEREEFKKAQHHLRRFAKEVRQIELTVTDGSVGGWRPERRSHRCFGKHSISPIQLSRFLGCIRQINHEGPRYAYGSAGGLYPVQLYLYVKPGRIEGTPGGVYYYDPADHRLALISENAEIGKGIHEPFINAPIFEESAFSIFLVAELNAIAPMYGERSIHFATIEAGAMSQLLEMSAARNDMGLCQIGAIDFARVRELFELQDSQVLIHSLVGGAVQGAGNGSPSTQEPYYYPANTTEVCEEGEI
jgi:SagB-type dehydrogenase family enzyme